MRCRWVAAASNCLCQTEDLRAFRQGLRQLPTTILIDDSHLIVSIRSCECGRHYLSVFTEIVDWTGGDDSQLHQIIEIDPILASHLASRGDLDEDALNDLAIHGRIVAWSHPASGIEAIRSYVGPFLVPFHD